MKLAEALQERADLARAVSQLRVRLSNNATAQEGESPAESPQELLEALSAHCARLEELIARINQTNSAARLEDGRTLTQLIARRDVLQLRLAALRELRDSASALTPRASRSEIRIVSTVDVRALQKQIDDLSRELRLTDNALQQANWTVELI